MLDKRQTRVPVAMAMSASLDATLLPTEAAQLVAISNKTSKTKDKDKDKDKAKDDLNTNLNVNVNANASVNFSIKASPTKKAKAILGWLKSATTTTTTTTTTAATTTTNASVNKEIRVHNNDYNHKGNPCGGIVKNSPVAATHHTCTCDAEKTRARIADGTLRDFRGVQTLRHIWNKRISACDEGVHNTKAINQRKLSKLNKSVSCLVNAINNAHETHEIRNHIGETRAKRALSLHDCTLLENDDPEVETGHLLDKQSNIDCLHRAKDNFYKYKTAEQATLHLARVKSRRASVGVVGMTMTEDAHFPAVQTSERGERIHWLKRTDIGMSKRGGGGGGGAKVKAATAAAKTATTVAGSLSGAGSVDDDVISNAESKRSIDDVVVNVVDETNENNETNDVNVSQIAKNFNNIANRNANINTNTNTNTNNSDSNNNNGCGVGGGNSETSSVSGDNTITAGSTPDSPVHEVSIREHRTPCGKSNLSSASDDSKRGSCESLTSSLHSGGTTTTTKTVNSQGHSSTGTRRRYSFKTHAGRAYTRHTTSRRTSMNKSKDVTLGGAGASSATSTAGTSVVAKLTQQFNEIILKDSRVLDEVKRNNGIWLARGAHVYKVVEKGNPGQRSSSKAKREEKRNSLVQCTINKFEHGITTLGLAEKPLTTGKMTLTLEKPMVPMKSVQVVRKHKELGVPTRPKTLTLNSVLSGKRANHCLAAQAAELKLEVVREETKTPLESIDKCLSLVATKEEVDDKSTAMRDDSLDLHWTVADVAKESAIEIQNVSDPKPATIDSTATMTQETFTTVDEEADAVAVADNAADAVGYEANDDDADVANAEKQKQRKHKYAKIYEKFRFRSPFTSSQQKKMKVTMNTKTAVAAPTIAASGSTYEATKIASDTDTAIAEEVVEFATTTSTKTKKTTTTTPAAEAEAKILAAIEVIDQKLKDLTVKTIDTVTDGAAALEVVVAANDDFEQRILPNTSFVHQTAQISNNKLLVTQAVNVALVNAIEGEQMVMEQKQLQVNHEQPQQEQQVVAQEESMYEPIAQEQVAGDAISPKTEPQQSFLFGTLAKSNTAKTSSALLEDIYQTVDEALTTVEDYESIASSCEHSNSVPLLISKMSHYDGYESFEPIDAEHPVPTTACTPAINGVLMRNTNDELPELPKPKRRLPKSPMPCKRGPTPPAKVTSALKWSSQTTRLPEPVEHHYYADDDEENIYDTIKGGSTSHCYESVQKSGSTSTIRNGIDSISLTSNCYEIITHYRRVGNTGVNNQSISSSGGSSLTISSDHKTNSLYEVSMAAGLLYGTGSLGCRSSLCSSAAVSRRSSRQCSTTANERCSTTSDNSDDWVDMSDAEAEAPAADDKRQFIVVRERSKIHRSPDWSKRIRDKRLQQQKAMSYVEDDSDHFYEPLSPLGNKRQAPLEHTHSHYKLNQGGTSAFVPGTQRPHQNHRQPLQQQQQQIHRPCSDDYDSFDTDTDEHEERLQNQNDSGVDIRNHRLPEPPQSTNQVYAIVRKLKNFISSKKSPGGSQQKLYENTSQFYVEDTVYNRQAKPSKAKTTTKVEPTKKTQRDQTSHDIYENAEFHTPAAINMKDVKSLSTSEKNLPTYAAENGGGDVKMANNVTPRAKSSKSFSRLRKSLGGSSAFDAKRLSTLTGSRSTFYIEEPSQMGGGEFDSGFLECVTANSEPSGHNCAAMKNVPSAEAQKFSTVARKVKKAKENMKAQRRRTTIGIRPHEPPPPPPPSERDARQQVTSWYADCGVFKPGGNGTPDDGSRSVTNSQSGSGNNSWYTEAGLYQTSGVSVASSSGSSGVSMGTETGLGDELSHSLFFNEPLYQIYNAAKLESISRDLADMEGGSTDGYEEIGLHRRSADSTDCNVRKSLRPSALQLVEPTNGPSRTLWSQIPEVINSCILPTLTPRERGLQEAKFEIVTSEASYLKSLNLLRSHFMQHTAFRDMNILSARDRKALFAYIAPVHECSERLLTELESCWQENIMLLGLSKRIYAMAEQHFQVYIAFCEHQGRMDRTLRRLKSTPGAFRQHLEKLEASPTCCSLNLHSFLMLPMQRITRLPLLIDAVFSKVAPSNDEYESWKMTLAIMNKIVAQCNEAANRCEQAYEIERISRQLEFPNTIRALAIAPAGMPALGAKPRFLVKKGDLTHLIWRGEDAKLTFGKRFIKAGIYAFLFSDLLVLTKRKGEEQFTVFDYCPRSMLTIASGDTLPQLPTKDFNQTGKNLILMTLLENHERKTVELLLSCPSVSEQERWLQAMQPPEAETPGEKLYEAWDCPQVITKHNYKSEEPDVLDLDVGDVVNVTRKLPDGWYQGERIRDGAVGWFPGSYTEEVNSAHVRSRNLKQRYRLLTFTATYLESQKRK